MLLIVSIYATLISTVSTLTCTSCEFKLLPPHNSKCNETCEGDVCFIVVNKFFNGTINAGCMYLQEGDTFDNDAICQRTSYDNRCACDTADQCNDPKVKLSTYTFTEDPVLADYQWLPQIQPEMPAIQPLSPISSEFDISNKTDSESSELIDSISKDIDGVFENSTQMEKAEDNVTPLLNTFTSTPIPILHRNEEMENDESEMTLSTRVAINVRENISSETEPRIEGELEISSPTIGEGSVEVTRMSEEHGARSTATMRPESSNLGTENVNIASMVPNIFTLFALISLYFI